MLSKLLHYLRDTRAEVKHVSWPTQRQAITYTAIVIILSIVTALYLGVFDFLFTNVLDKFLLNL